MSKLRTFIGRLSIPLVAVCLVISPYRVTAQEWNVGYATTPAAIATRDQEYTDLAREVAAMERELGLIKRVVKLVNPTVVHIEASPKDEPRRGAIMVEEGSGVVVQFGTRFFVLTNRHVIRESIPERIRIQLADG